MNELDLKNEKIQKIVKIVAAGGICFLIAPIIVSVIGGLIGGIAALTIGFTAVQFAPVAARFIANKRLQSLKYTASLNPVETYELDLKDQLLKLDAKKKHIEETHSIASDLATKIEEHNRNFPGRPSQNQKRLDQLNSYIESISLDYKKTKKELKDYSTFIDEQRSEWEIAKSFNKVEQLQNVAKEFESKMMTNEAFKTIRNGVNAAWARMETNKLDLDDSPTTTVVITDVKPKSITQKSSVVSLDLDDDKINNQIPGNNRQKITV